MMMMMMMMIPYHSELQEDIFPLFSKKSLFCLVVLSLFNFRFCVCKYPL